MFGRKEEYLCRSGRRNRNAHHRRQSGNHRPDFTHLHSPSLTIFLPGIANRVSRCRSVRRPSDSFWLAPRRLAGLAAHHRYAYTRYADDLTFSGDQPEAIGKLLGSVRRVVKEEGFTEHPAKTRIMRQGNRQEVTGLTVNERPTISRREYRRLRALLHNAARDGLESQNTENRPNFLNHLKGKIAFIKMVDPDKGEKLQAALDRVIPGT